MQNTLKNQVLALAGIYQSSFMIHQIATTGKCSYDDFKTVLNSLFMTKIDDFNTAFGGINKFKSGLTAIKNNLSMVQPGVENLYINRYSTSICGLEKEINRKQGIMQQLVEEISNLQGKEKNIDKDIENIIDSLAKIYTKYISANAKTILVKGSQGHLKNEFNISKIRTLLLAAFRFSVLWSQIGGRKWHFLFKRQAIINQSDELLKNI